MKMTLSSARMTSSIIRSKPKGRFKNKSWEQPTMKTVPSTPTPVLIGTVNGTVSTVQFMRSVSLFQNDNLHLW